jgi:hypothetical protein
MQLCQAHDTLSAPGVIWRISRRVRRAMPGRSALRRLFRRAPAARFGAASRFAPGDWVRVLDAERVRATLDGKSALRGLEFVSQQWAYCGGVHRVAAPVQRILDDFGRMRAVARTVTLDGVTCGGTSGQAGCGRECPLFFRDEWLEPATAPAEISVEGGPFARVRSRREIAATLDGAGRLDGVSFMPEMYAFAGRRFRVAKRVDCVYELDREARAAIPVFVLDGLRCTGAVLGARGPCDRACSLLWHERWLELE